MILSAQRPSGPSPPDFPTPPRLSPRDIAKAWIEAQDMVGGPTGADPTLIQRTKMTSGKLFIQFAYLGEDQTKTYHVK